MYHKSAPFPVYCHECFYGDKWDPLSYGREYDFDKPFFEQFKNLFDVVPRVSLFQRNSINSDYSNMVGEAKNVYLSASVVKNSENIFYSKCIDSSKDIVDCLNIINGSESLYENVEGQRNYNSQYLLLCRDCIDTYYSVDCINCSNCVLSYNLRNKKFCIRNKQYTKEEYFVELEKLNLKSRASRQVLLREFEEIKNKAIYRFGNITKCVNVTGNNMLNVKNSKNCFEIYNAEDSKNCFRGFEFKDCMDFDFGGKSELIYEYTSGGLNDFNVKFSHAALDQVQNANYSDYCKNSTNIFGCIALRNNKYVIFNKIYEKEEFQKLKDQIIEQMNNFPFVDNAGRIYKYGEFFPIELSPFAYNETLAQELFPITKDQAENNFYPWRDPEVKDFNITVPCDEIPDNIDEINESFLKEVLECSHKGKCDQQCNLAFRLTSYELMFYKKHDIPLPILCPNCRHYERSKVMPSLKLYHRSCMCDKNGHFHGAGKCEVEFETSYALDRPEIVYCEKCYQQEVY
jgi:hypothetical protein